MSMPAEFPDAGAGSTLPSPQTPASIRLYPPRVRANLVERSSLISRLSEDPDRQLTLICAPAGYGKSTLVVQWATELALPTAWVRLEPDDNDPATFFSLVLDALRLIDRDFAAGTASRLTEHGLPADTIVHELIEDLSVATRSFILVLDDYQEIEESAIHLALDQLMQHLPAAMRLVLISRTVPPLRLARLQASGEVLVVTQSDLQFTVEETLQYVHSLDLDLAPSEVRLLHERTEGWVIGLQMVGSALRGRTRDQTEQFIRDFVGSVDLGDRYLWEEVLERQPEDVLSFLLQTSVLDRFNPDLCDAITQAGHGDEMIRRCERENLFILPLVGQGAWYRFHHLFADALREQLGRTATEGEIGDLHRQAANGSRPMAILRMLFATRLLVAIGPMPSLCSRWCALSFSNAIISRHCGAGCRGYRPTSSLPLRNWPSGWPGRTGARVAGPGEAPHSVSPRRPGQRVGIAWARDWFFSGMRAASSGTRTPAAHRLRATIVRLPASRSTFRTYPRFDDARDRPPQSWGAGRSPSRLFRCQNVDRHLESLLASTVRDDLFRDRPDAAREAAGSVDAVSTGDPRCGRPTKGDLVSTAQYHLGCIFLEWGLLDDARRALERADQESEMMQTLHWRSQIRVALARVAWAQGEREVALDEIEQAVALANQSNTLQLVRDACAQQARLWLKSNRPALATLGQELRPRSVLPPEYERQIELLTYVRLLIHQGRHDLALAILKRIDQYAKESGRHGDRVEIALLTALAHKGSNNAPEAFQALHDALALGSLGGYLRTFVDEEGNMAALYAMHRLASATATMSRLSWPRSARRPL